MAAKDSKGRTVYVSGYPEFVPLSARGTANAIRFTDVEVNLVTSSTLERLAFDRDRHELIDALKAVEIGLGPLLDPLTASLSGNLALAAAGLTLTCNVTDLHIDSINLAKKGDLEVAGSVSAIAALKL